MSLKAFHIVFIAGSVILAVGFGVWAAREYSSAGDRTMLVMSGSSFASAAVLMVYGRWFLRKLKAHSYV
ncbi:MAG: hypothetical protein KF841_10370 [Phycisphaerae bacterium]|nr:hypothetical protein [Phycisphaerae bacterium]